MTPTSLGGLYEPPVFPYSPPPMATRQKKLDPAFAAAIEKAGSKVNLATALGVSKAAVSQWRAIPIRHVERVNALYGIARRRLLEPHL